jgi:hypothetical protein
LSDFIDMCPRVVVLAAIANFSAVAAWSQERPKVIFNPPRASPEAMALSCVLTCEKPCAKWASWQTDPQFSYEACVAKCRDEPSCGLYAIVPGAGRRQPP